MARADLPLTILIRQRSQELGLSRSELVQRCGYKNISKGLRRLDQVYGGEFDKAGALLGKIPEALNLSPETIQEAIDATTRQIAAEADALFRASFKPAAYLLGSTDRPSQIFRSYRWRGEMAQDSTRYITVAHYLRGTGSGGSAKNPNSSIFRANNRIHCELHPRSCGAFRLGG
jgi:hypothetical protein